MRRVLGLGLLGAMAAACHEPRQTQAVQAAAVVDKEELDFGEVPVGEWAEREVLIRNVGVVPFFALEALALDGNPSYRVDLVDGESRVMPGESKVVRVRFHPLREGAIEERLKVRTDANTGAESTVTVRGLGGPTPVGINPPVLDFETLEVDSDRALTLTITNPVDLPLTVTVGGDKADPFSTDTVTIPPLSTQQVTTRYLPRELGRMGARVEVRACEGCTPATAELTGTSVESAFVFEPTPVYFAPIPVHERTDTKARARNITWRPVTISSLSTSDQGFAPTVSLDGRQVAPGEAVPLDLRFAARTSGPTVAELTVKYSSDRERQAKVMLDARGGRPTLAVTPMMLDFGELPVGGKVARVVRISNGGSTGNLGFLSVRAEGASSEFIVDAPNRGAQSYPWAGGTWPSLQAASGITIAPGNDAIELKVYFEPKTDGSHQATLTLVSDDPFTPERTLVLTGKARTSGPCTFVLKPQPMLDFGNVAPGKSAVLGFRMENPGRAECAVKDIHISNDGGGAFLMPGGRITGGVMLYDTAFSAMVAFRPPAAGNYTGELKLTVNNPANPTVTLPLKGLSQQSCLVATPPFVDFGPIRYDCSPKARRTLVSNQCPQPITVENARIGEGTSNQFQLVTPLNGQRTLLPGEGFELEFTYARNVLGQHYSPFFLKVSGEPQPLTVALLAETNHEGVQLDNFVQGTDSQLDVLFVVSNTTTMQPYQDKLRAALPGWLAYAQREGVDVRVGVTSTALSPRAVCGGSSQGGDGGRLLPLDGSRPRVVSGTAANAAQTLQSNVGVGLCHNLVQGLETARQALSSPLADSQDDPRTPQPNDGNLGLLRPTARLAVVALSDEDDHSGFPADSYTQFFQSIKGPGMSHRAQFYALVPTDTRCTTAGGPGERFSSVARATGGSVESVCQGSYQSFLERLIGRAGEPQADFPLSSTPDGVSHMAVRVQGRTVDPTLWRYDASRNAIVFQPTAVPKTGESIQIRYRSVCRNP